METIQTRAQKIAEQLNKAYPGVHSELIHKNEVEFTIAVMLSAQTTDKKVNQITKYLFEKYKTWQNYANADLVELQKDIHGVNFHLGKAERIIKAAKMIQDTFGGKLPHTMTELIKIPGIARKSANVILIELWNITEGIVVDTHVTRLSKRLGLTNGDNAVKIEQDLVKVIPYEYWANFSMALVLHGRYVCKAQRPNCRECLLKALCPSFAVFCQDVSTLK